MMPPHLLAIRNNAFRLYEDAVALSRDGRYASAIALAILAIEEVGKYLIKAEGRSEGKASQLHHHGPKQRAVSRRFLTDLRMCLRLPGDLSLKRLSELRSLGPFGEVPPTRTEVSEQLEEAFEQAVQEKASELLRARYVISAGMGDISKAKERVLYVDIGPNKQVLSDPSQCTAAEMEQWLRQADRALTEIAYDE